MIDNRTNNLRAIKALWVLYALFVVYGTTIPFKFSLDSHELALKIAGIQWIPFVDSTTHQRVSIPDMVQNIMLFIPFGALGYWTNLRKQSGNVSNGTIVILFGSCLSLSVEALQLFTPDRITSITDLMMNTTGAFAGFVAAHMISKSFIRCVSLTIVREYLRQPFAYFFLISLILVIVVEWEPFDFTLDVGSVFPKIKLLLTPPFTFSSMLKSEPMLFFDFFLLGFTCAVLFKSVGMPGYTSRAFLLTTAIGTFLESSQLIVTSRMPQSQSAVAIWLACLCGSFFERVNPSRSFAVLWAPLTILATGISAAFIILSPFHFVGQYHGFNWIPFLPYYEQTSFVALSNFIEGALLYGPMGFILKHLFPEERWVPLLAAGAALAVSLPMEYLQGWTPDRFPDLTSVLSALCGAISGVIANSSGRHQFDAFVERVTSQDVP
jgi:glycopeptide antibiotics resistance protein